MILINFYFSEIVSKKWDWWQNLPLELTTSNFYKEGSRTPPYAFHLPAGSYEGVNSLATINRGTLFL